MPYFSPCKINAMIRNMNLTIIRKRICFIYHSRWDYDILSFKSKSSFYLLNIRHSILNNIDKIVMSLSSLCGQKVVVLYVVKNLFHDLYLLIFSFLPIKFSKYVN